MNESNSTEAIDKTNLPEQATFRQSEIIGMENYFHQKINQRKSCSKKLNKFFTTFDYIDKILIAVSETSNGVSIISFTSIVGAPVGIESASFTLISSLTKEIVKKLINITSNKKKSMTKILCWLKVNSIALKL